jgi:hypothetical protein
VTDEFLDDDGTDGQIDEPGQGDNPNIRQLREKARKHDAVAAERDEARRELAFYKAGIPDNKVAELFKKAYDGDVDPDAIRTAAAEYGLVDPDVPHEELDAMDRLEKATAGGEAPPPAVDMNSMIRAAAGHSPN